jgi:hypothetical protein
MNASGLSHRTVTSIDDLNVHRDRWERDVTTDEGAIIVGLHTVGVRSRADSSMTSLAVTAHRFARLVHTADARRKSNCDASAEPPGPRASAHTDRIIDANDRAIRAIVACLRDRAPRTSHAPACA